MIKYLIIIVAFISLFLGKNMFAKNTQVTNASSCVIILHGLGRTSDSMSKIADELGQNGYKVWNQSYPSRDKPINELAQAAIEPALEFCQTENIKHINFVTHSLGGILVRYYLQDNAIENLNRIVMLSPPNKGSEIVDRLKELKLFQFVTGPVGQQLGTDASSLPNQLKPIKGEIGIVIGNSTSDPWFSWLIPGDDDGKVSVASSKLNEMKDFLIVEHGHTFIMRKDDVINQIQHFLINGEFQHPTNG